MRRKSLPAKADIAMKSRTVFFVSDQTGVTAETLGHSLLTQFDGLKFQHVTVPFISTLDKARDAVAQINRRAREDDARPIIFSTLVQDHLRREVQESDGLFLDFFDAFLGPLEKELNIRSSHTAGRAHGMVDLGSYTERMNATNYALANDDGKSHGKYAEADVILIGVSRSGKTPTCLYLALQYGIYAANFPLTEEDFEHGDLPRSLKDFLPKLYGLTIDPVRLQQIRQERRPESRYASTQQVTFEVRAAEALYDRLGIRYIDTTHSSIEEIASTILLETGIERRVRP